VNQRSSAAQQALDTLGSRLREIRYLAGLSGRELGERCGWPGSKVSRIEHGRQVPQAEEVRLWCLRCGADEQLPELLASLHNYESLYVGWSRLERNGFKAPNESINSLWERTTHVRVYATHRIPGPIQSEAYVRTVLQLLRERRDVADDVEETVALRMERQQLINNPRRRFAFVLEEATLHSRFGTDRMLAEQLANLLIIAGLPAVSLGIVPTGVHRPSLWPSESFWMFDDDRVMLDLWTGQMTITDPVEVTSYGQVFGELSGIAVYGAQARRLITAAIDALEG
jgi:transcriptional regulator with XRE-family HTH domain